MNKEYIIAKLAELIDTDKYMIHDSGNGRVSVWKRWIGNIAWISLSDHDMWDIRFPGGSGHYPRKSLDFAINKIAFEVNCETPKEN